LKVDVADTNNFIYINVTLAGSITAPSYSSKSLRIELDIDRDSRSGTWDMEYYILYEIYSGGSESCILMDSSNNAVNTSLNFVGGKGTNYVNITVQKSNINNLGDAFYLYLKTTAFGSSCDEAPNSGTDAGDYYIYYISPPSPTSQWTSQSDSTGEVADSSLDIYSLSSAYDSSYLYFKLTLVGTYGWYGGSDTAVYRIYIDADKNPSTGNSVSGVSDFGADYMIEFIIGYIPKLYYASGSWTFIKNVEYIQNPGDSSEVTILAPKSDFNQVPLGGDVKITAETAQDSTQKDVIETAFISPIPECTIFVSLSIIAVIVAVLFIHRKKTLE
ncbi:hypothetical protein DRN87_05510, partial [Candidatus Geothermarchaeota archaeon]